MLSRYNFLICVFTIDNNITVLVLANKNDITVIHYIAENKSLVMLPRPPSSARATFLAENSADFVVELL